MKEIHHTVSFLTKKEKRGKKVCHIWNKNKRTKVASEKRKCESDKEISHLVDVMLHVA